VVVDTEASCLYLFGEEGAVERGRVIISWNMGSSGEKHAMLKRRVEDRMLEWKCKIENPPRKVKKEKVTFTVAAQNRENNIDGPQQKESKTITLTSFYFLSFGI